MATTAELNLTYDLMRKLTLKNSYLELLAPVEIWLNGHVSPFQQFVG